MLRAQTKSAPPGPVVFASPRLLAYVGLMRAMLGNNQWAYAAMNRRGTIVFGNGIVNGQDYTAQRMRELMDDAGELERSAVTAVQCRGW